MMCATYQPVSDDERKSVVHSLHVTRHAVEDPTNGRGVEERHGRVQNAVSQSGVEDAGCYDHARPEQVVEDQQENHCKQVNR